MTRRTACLLALALILLPGCASVPNGAPGATVAPAPPIRFVIVHVNDIYELSPLDGGRVGGMARLAAIVRQLRANVPNVVVVHAGDFASPSLLSGLKRDVDGRQVPIAGEQMVAAMNAVGFDYVTFGNHEFDIPEASLEARLEESDFTYVAANVRHRDPESGAVTRFARRGEPIPDFAVHVVTAPDGRQVRLGIVGLTLPFNRSPYVAYEDIYEAGERAVADTAAVSDVVIALTHLNVDEDRELARRLPQLPLILGGHEHEHMLIEEGPTTIAKADANARTVYIHFLAYDAATRHLDHWSLLVPITNDLADDPQVAALVSRWEATGDALIAAQGYAPNEVIADFTAPQDGRQESVRARQTDLGALIACALRAADPLGAELAVVNGGSIRVDDQLIGQVRQKDVLRILPFGGPLVHGRMAGRDLERVLRVGLETNRGRGGYLQTTPNVGHAGDAFTVDGRPLDADRDYQLALPAFLAHGLEENLGFLSDAGTYTEPEGMVGVGGQSRNDLRDALILFLRAGRSCDDGPTM
jgi:2',3'-cyclic-nucleotide 2'-phosphodiesterase (5'-nucleotidase family)